MNKYEAMFIVKPDLPEEERKTLFSQISEAVLKHKGEIVSAAVWAEKRKLHFPLKKQHEGLYYLTDFTLDPAAVGELKQVYKLNENILRVLITRNE
jgi:small subunit ribosomal protein S6